MKFFVEENKSKLQKLFFSMNSNVIITLVFFVFYRLNAFTFYMNFWDFISYISLVFLVSQFFSFLSSILILMLSNVIDSFLGRRSCFPVIYNIVACGGYSVSLFAFIFSVERIFVSQYWLNQINITEVWRSIIELCYGISIFIFIIYLQNRSGKRKFTSENRTVQDEEKAYKVDGLKRRLLVTSSASAVAAVAVGSRIIMGNQFGLPVDYSVSDKRENPKNVILVTFDALAAADMSVYGYGLNTTPNIDLFANSSDVHTNFYACSTFTTPCLSSILTGRYPSSSRIHQLGGMLHGGDTYRTLPAILKRAGYKTGLICGNPYAMPLMGSTQGAFDHLCAAPRAGWTDLPPSEFLEIPGMTDLIDLAERTVTVSGLVVPALRQGFSETPPHATFQAAKKLISNIDGPFFIWIHVMAPHGPYLPSEEFRHRYLKSGVLETRQDMLRPRIMDRSKGKSQIQTDIQHLRLRYDEWVAEADSAFGEFISFVKKSGLMKDTMTMVSADHGEFFMPESYGHGGDVFHRSLINIPMIVKMPGQEVGRHINAVADQTAIAPTILDAVGLSAPQWMSGTRLSRGALEPDGGTANSGVAVTQYLEENSSFKPVTTGTIGAVKDGFQYVRTLSTGEEKLYVMEDAATVGGSSEGERRDVKGDVKHTLESIRGDLKVKFPRLKI